MHEDIQKLIDIVKEYGELTDKQKEIILRKAEKLGEDVDEVEMLLESIKFQSPQKSENSVRIKMRNCPNCGAKVPANDVKCPECGYIMESEAESNTRNRDYLSELFKELANLSGKQNTEKRIERIRGMNMPMTFDAQVMGYNAAKSRYEGYVSIVGTENYDCHQDIIEAKERAAWLAKAKEFYFNVESLRGDDQARRSWLESNKGILAIQGKEVWTTGGVFGLIILVLMAFGLAYVEWTYLSWSQFWKVVLIIYTASIPLLCITKLPKKLI